jgi:hypothetical protein
MIVGSFEPMGAVGLSDLANVDGVDRVLGMARVSGGRLTGVRPRNRNRSINFRSARRLMVHAT